VVSANSGGFSIPISDPPSETAVETRAIIEESDGRNKVQAASSFLLDIWHLLIAAESGTAYDAIVIWTTAIGSVRPEPASGTPGSASTASCT